jgi:hypothetical protein
VAETLPYALNRRGNRLQFTAYDDIRIGLFGLDGKVIRRASLPRGNGMQIKLPPGVIVVRVNGDHRRYRHLICITEM